MRKLYLFVFLLALQVQLSCRYQSENPPPAPPVKSEFHDPYPLPEDAYSADVTGKRGGRLISAMLTDPKTFNPLLANETDSQTLNQLMNPGLTKLNFITQQPEPALAKSWDVSSDNLTWTFHLRKGVQWTDGHPFTADDVIFTMQMVNDPKIESSAHDALLIEIGRAHI